MCANVSQPFFHFHHYNIAVASMATQVAFYRDHLTFTRTLSNHTTTDPYPVTFVQLQNTAGVILELNSNPRSQWPCNRTAYRDVLDPTLRRGYFNVAFQVDDVAAVYRELMKEGTGATSVAPPTGDGSGGAFAEIADPEGNAILFTSQSM